MDILDASQYDVRAQAGEEPYVSDDDDVAQLDLQDRSDDNIQAWTLPADKTDEFEGEDNDERTELIYNLINNDNVTQTDEIAIEDVDDTAIVQVESSGLEGAIEYHLDDAGGGAGSGTAAYANISNGSAADYSDTVGDGTPGGPYVQPFALAFDDDEATANRDDIRDTLGDEISQSSFQVTYDEANDTHFVVFEELGNTLSADDGDDYGANFSISDSDGDGLSEDSVTQTDDFSTVDADGTVNDGDRITVTANEGQTLTAETNVAPGTEVTIRARSTSQTAGAPFLKQPTGVVQPDGTVEATGDFSDAEAGSNFTAQIRVGGTNVGDSVEGTVLEAAAETPTEGTEVTPEETEEPTEMQTEEPTEMQTDEPTEMQTDEPTEETTTGGSGPGFTAAIALIALIAAALLAVRRDN